ncbi:MAG: M56 family metallopeptidase [Chitinophagales bacterium]
MNSSLVFEASPITLALGWTIVHTLWQATVIGLVLKLILSLFSNQLSNLRYLVSCLALVLCVVWTGYTFHEEWELYQEQEAIILEIPTEELQNAQLVDHESSDTSLLTIGGLNQWKNLVRDYIPMIVCCWFLGVLFFAYWLFQGFIRLHQLQKKGLYPTPDKWNTRLAKLCEQMGIARNVQLLISNKVEGPVTFRLFKPVILLPIQLFTGLSVTQIEVLLLHELAHIRRLDYAVNLCQSAIEVLLFFHPLIWWINRQIRLEREHCCDDLVLQIQSNPHLYAHALTSAQVKYFSLKTNLAVSANQEQGHLTTRIHRLFGKYEYSVVSMKGVFMALILVTGLLVQEISAQKNVYPEAYEKEILVENTEAANLEIPTVIEETQAAKNVEPKSPEKSEPIEESQPSKEDAVSEPIEEKPESIFNQNSHKQVDDLPKNATPGKCYQKIKAEGAYVSKEYLVYTGDLANAPKGVTKMVLETTPATTKWVRKKMGGDECMCANPEDCKVWCLRDIPAKKQEVWVLKDASQSNQFERKTIKTYVLTKQGRLEWLEIPCEKQFTQQQVIQIQRVLQSRNYDAGNNGVMDIKFFDGLTQFQQANNLPIGKVDAHIMMLLGLEY